MAGAFFGALLALGLSVVFSWNQPAGGSGSQLSPEAEAAFHAPPGSCLDWQQPDASDAHTVNCTAPHLFEVTGEVDVGPQYPEGAPPLDLEVARQISQERCTDGAKQYLGKSLDPYGRLTVNLLRPTAAQWNDGDRQLRCGLQWSGPGGSLQHLTGPAKEQQQSLVWEPGTCLALLGKTFGDPVDCSTPHAYEIISTVDLGKKFTKSYPSQDDQKEWLDTECEKAAEDYTGGADLGAKKLVLTWDVREQESWDVDSTLVNCKVGAALPDGSGLAPVTGSVRKTVDSEPGKPSDGSGSDQPSEAPKSGESSPTSGSDGG